MKTCTKCKIDKEFKDFNPRDGAADGYNSSCRSCVAAQHKLYNEVRKRKQKEFEMKKKREEG